MSLSLEVERQSPEERSTRMMPKTGIIMLLNHRNFDELVYFLHLALGHSFKISLAVLEFTKLLWLSVSAIQAIVLRPEAVFIHIATFRVGFSILGFRSLNAGLAECWKLNFGLIKLTWCQSTMSSWTYEFWGSSDSWVNSCNMSWSLVLDDVSLSSWMLRTLGVWLHK